MTTCSLLDAINAGTVNWQSPLQRAQDAIYNDDYLTLKDLLATHAVSITEETFVHPETKENLLHCAVRQLAAHCVALLLDPPFAWSPTKPNAFQHTALDLALRWGGYIPVVWPPAAAAAASNGSCHARNASTTTTKPTLTSLLLCIDGKDQINNDFQDYLDRSIELLFELIRCSPREVFHGDGAVEVNLSPLFCATCSATEVSSSSSSNNNSCSLLVDVVAPTGVYQAVKDAYRCWLARDAKTTTTSRRQPRTLAQLCRSVIRRWVYKGILQQQQRSQVGAVFNYASAIASLRLPRRLERFLAFEELWPRIKSKDLQDFRRSLASSAQ